MAQESLKDEAEILTPTTTTATTSPSSPPSSPPPPSPLLFKSEETTPSQKQEEDKSIVTTTPLSSLKKNRGTTSNNNDSSDGDCVSRCSSCNKRVGLTGFRCRCGELFCPRHRYSDTHDCSFDYKAAARAQISKANPVIRAAKIIKI